VLGWPIGRARKSIGTVRGPLAGGRASRPGRRAKRRSGSGHAHTSAGWDGQEARGGNGPPSSRPSAPAGNRAESRQGRPSSWVDGLHRSSGSGWALEGQPSGDARLVSGAEPAGWPRIGDEPKSNEARGHGGDLPGEEGTAPASGGRSGVGTVAGGDDRQRRVRGAAVARGGGPGTQEAKGDCVRGSAPGSRERSGRARNPPGAPPWWSRILEWGVGSGAREEAGIPPPAGREARLNAGRWRPIAVPGFERQPTPGSGATRVGGPGSETGPLIYDSLA